MWRETICVMFLIAISKANYYEEDYSDGNDANVLRKPTHSPGHQKNYDDSVTEQNAAEIAIDDETTNTPLKRPSGPGVIIETTAVIADEMETPAAITGEMETPAVIADELETTAAIANEMETTAAIANAVETEITTYIPTTTYEATTEKTNLRQDTTFIKFHKEINATELNDTAESIADLLHTYKDAILDLPALMDLIMNLTGEFETNLTNKLNESLQRMSLPTCPTPPIETTTSEYDANYTGSIVARCFVCGLDVEGIPVKAHCADAFAGDFMPLVPVDPTAKASASGFRRYCKYQNSPGWSVNSTQPRAIFGRWTGGCAVRWIDLSSVYTQRVCRSRLNPVMGRHYVSKRMAKLEKALWNIDNGCIVSPMATLVPMSRAISLYARFHVCVCTGNWCNRAIEGKQVNAFIGLVVILLSVLFS